MTPTVGVIVLAAGGSRRLGTPKQLMAIEGEPLLRKSVRAALEAGLGPVVVVLGGHGERVRTAIVDLNVVQVDNPAWEAGIGTSIQSGIQGIVHQCPEIIAALLMVGDQPGLGATHLQALAAAYAAGGGAIAAASYAGVLGTPALFDRSLFPALLALAPDEGAKRLIRAYASSVAAVPFWEGEEDIDTLADLARWQARGH